MKEIKESNSGISYAPPKRLKQGPRVYSQAILNKVPHNTEGKNDFSLKLGRYNITGGVETIMPKSELTLNNEEFNSLIDYLEEYYKPLELNAKKFISIDSSQSSIMLKKFKSMMKSNEEAAQFLVYNDLAGEDISAAISAIKKKQAVAEFERALESDCNEHFWQKWLQNNKWILGSEYIKIIEERSIDTTHIADYLMQAFDGFVDIVEIKKPNNVKFWAGKDRGNYVQSLDLTKAITQCQNYLYEIERESNSVKFLERVNAKVIKPRCLLVFGRSHDWDDEMRKAFRILNSSYTQITILTYDHLLKKAKNIANDVLQVSVKENIYYEDDDLPF